MACACILERSRSIHVLQSRLYMEWLKREVGSGILQIINRFRHRDIHSSKRIDDIFKGGEVHFHGIVHGNIERDPHLLRYFFQRKDRGFLPGLSFSLQRDPVIPPKSIEPPRFHLLGMQEIEITGEREEHSIRFSSTVADACDHDRIREVDAIVIFVPLPKQQDVRCARIIRGKLCPGAFHKRGERNCSDLEEEGDRQDQNDRSSDACETQCEEPLRADLLLVFLLLRRIDLLGKGENRAPEEERKFRNPPPGERFLLLFDPAHVEGHVGRGYWFTGGFGRLCCRVSHHFLLSFSKGSTMDSCLLLC